MRPLWSYGVVGADRRRALSPTFPELLFFLPKHSRTRLPLPGSDACGRIIFGLLSHVTDDKYATLAQDVDLRVLAPRVGTVPLQDKPHRLHVHFANGLWYRVSVLI